VTFLKKLHEKKIFAFQNSIEKRCYELKEHDRQGKGPQKSVTDAAPSLTIEYIKEKKLEEHKDKTIAETAGQVKRFLQDMAKFQTSELDGIDIIENKVKRSQEKLEALLRAGDSKEYLSSKNLVAAMRKYEACSGIKEKELAKYDALFHAFGVDTVSDFALVGKNWDDFAADHLGNSNKKSERTAEEKEKGDADEKEKDVPEPVMKKLHEKYIREFIAFISSMLDPLDNEEED